MRPVVETKMCLFRTLLTGKRTTFFVSTLHSMAVTKVRLQILRVLNESTMMRLHDICFFPHSHEKYRMVTIWTFLNEFRRRGHIRHEKISKINLPKICFLYFDFSFSTVVVNTLPYHCIPFLGLWGLFREHFTAPKVKGNPYLNRWTFFGGGIEECEMERYIQTAYSGGTDKFASAVVARADATHLHHWCSSHLSAGSLVVFSSLRVACRDCRWSFRWYRHCLTLKQCL